tara:strand:+ start:334 stop:1047 length:714 start_codon:yes stop_codon:yes gene_type:complete
MKQHTHLSTENFNQHVREVNEYMKQEDGTLNGNRGWDAMISELAESLREDHRGSLDIPASFQRAMTRVWDLIVYDTNNSPQDVVKTYYITEPIDRKKESGARIYVETFSFLSPDKWSLNTRVGLLTNNHSISSVLITEDVKQTNLSINESGEYRGTETPTVQLHVKPNLKDAEIRQQGQFDALMEKPRPSYPDMHLSKEERMARGKTDPVLERLEALEHDLTEVMTALVSKDIMRSH